MKRLLAVFVSAIIPRLALAGGGYISPPVGLDGLSVSPSTVSASQCFRSDSASSHFQAGPGCGAAEAVFNEASGDVNFRIESNDNANMLFLDAGINAVGINQAAPAGTLHIVSTSTVDGTPVIRIDNNAGAEQARIQQNGRVGIGTSNPATLLDVDDAAQFGDGATKSTFSALGVLTLATDLAVSEGGTGASTLTDGGILFGNGTAAIGATSVLTNGQLLIGDGTEEPTAATLTGNPAIVVTNGAGSITLSADSSSVTLRGPTIGLTSEVDGTLPVENGGTETTSLTDGGVLFGGGTGAITASSVLSNGQLLIGDGTTAPTAAALTQTSAETEITNGAGSITIGLPDTVGITENLGINDTTPEADLEIVSDRAETDFVLAVSSQNDTTGNMFTVLGNGNIGVGTANPAQKMHISSGTLTIDGSGGAFTVGVSTLVTASGHVGIGVANPASFRHGATAAAALHIGNGEDTNALGASTLLDLQQGDSSSLHLRNSADNKGIMLLCSSGSCYFEGDSGTDFEISDGVQFVLTIPAGSNKIGLGTRAPSTKLHMSSGTFTVDGNTQLVANFGGTVRLWSRTKVQIDTLVPGAAGETVFCSNCNTNGDVCVSTGTAAAQWHRVGAAASVGCGTNE